MPVTWKSDYQSTAFLELICNSFKNSYKVQNINNEECKIGVEILGDYWMTYSLGCNTTERTLFLWFVKVPLDFPAARSQSLMVASWLPLMTCGSELWHWTLATVLVWPVRVWMQALVLMSQILIEESLPQVAKISMVGCKARSKHALRWPW